MQHETFKKINGIEEPREVPVFSGGRLVGYATAGAADRIAEDPMIRREVDADFAGLVRSFPHLFRPVPDGAR